MTSRSALIGTVMLAQRPASLCWSMSAASRWASASASVPWMIKTESSCRSKASTDQKRPDALRAWSRLPAWLERRH